MTDNDYRIEDRSEKGRPNYTLRGFDGGGTQLVHLGAGRAGVSLHGAHLLVEVCGHLHYKLLHIGWQPSPHPKGNHLEIVVCQSYSYLAFILRSIISLSNPKVLQHPRKN